MYNFYNHDKNKFILLLQKVFYPYEYMEDWGKFNETSLPEKEDINNLYGWVMLQKLPANNFEWIKDTSEVNENLIKKI